MIESLLAMSKIRYLGFVVLAMAVAAWFIGWIKDRMS